MLHQRQAFRDHLTEQVNSLTEAHAHYKKSEAEAQGDVPKEYLNSIAAGIWDQKTLVEKLRDEFDKTMTPLQNTDQYDIHTLHIYGVNPDSVTVKHRETKETLTWEIAKQHDDETVLERVEKLLARVDRYFKLEDNAGPNTDATSPE